MNEPFPELPFSEEQLEIFSPQIRYIRRKVYEDCAVIAEDRGTPEGRAMSVVFRALAAYL